MKKQYLRPVPKTGNNDQTEKASGGKTRRKLTPKQIIIILSVTLIVSLAVVIPVCIFFIDIPLKPEFEPFDQEKDYAIRVKWNKVAAVTMYEYEYCHEDPTLSSTVKTRGNTKNNAVSIDRYAGPLFFRVCANKNGKSGKYSEWIRYDIDAWTLKEPTVRVDTTSMIVSWDPVTYVYNNKPIGVPAYNVRYGFEIDEVVYWQPDTIPTDTTHIDIGSNIVTLCKNNPLYVDYYTGLSSNDDWQDWPGDIILHIEVSALNYTVNSIDLSKNKTKEIKGLTNVYNDVGKSKTISVTITQEIFDRLAKEHDIINANS